MALSRRARSTRLLVITLVFISLMTITIDYRGGQSGPLEAAGKGALTVVGPMQQAVARVAHPVGAFFSGIVHIASLQSQNRQLQQQVRNLRTENTQAGEAISENDQLRGLLQIKQRLGLKGVAAGVIGESVSNFEWAVTIDAGSDQGVKADEAVVSGDGLVGHVTSVTPRWSKVTLILDPTSNVAGRLVQTGDSGLVVGNGNHDMVMQMVTPGAQVEPGEAIVTAGFRGGLYPAGILIGLVSHVAPAEGSLAKVVSIAPVVDFSSLQFVMVVTGTRPAPPTPPASPSGGASPSPSGASGG